MAHWQPVQPAAVPYGVGDYPPMPLALPHGGGFAPPWPGRQPEPQAAGSWGPPTGGQLAAAPAVPPFRWPAFVPETSMLLGHPAQPRQDDLLHARLLDDAVRMRMQDVELRHRQELHSLETRLRDMEAAAMQTPASRTPAVTPFALPPGMAIAATRTAAPPATAAPTPPWPYTRPPGPPPWPPSGACGAPPLWPPSGTAAPASPTAAVPTPIA